MSVHVSRPSQSWQRHANVIAGLAVALALFAAATAILPLAPFSDGGVRLVSKAALVVVALLVTAFARTLIGANPRRHFRMALGTLGGLALGIAISGPLTRMIGAEVSPIAAMCGVIVGWAVAYQFVKGIPRDVTPGA